jgi:hypothetical protein
MLPTKSTQSAPPGSAARYEVTLISIDPILKPAWSPFAPVASRRNLYRISQGLPATPEKTALEQLDDAE